MSQAAEELIQLGLQLPEEDRVRIARLLWRSIDEAHPRLQELSIVEVKAPATEVDDGIVEALPGDEAQARLR